MHKRLFICVTIVTSLISGYMYLDVTEGLTRSYVSMHDAVVMCAIFWSPILLLLPRLVRFLSNGAKIVELKTENKLTELKDKRKDN
jgi:hypothetical protein